MPYPRRKWIPHYFYHINTRGNSKQTIFHDPADFTMFLKLLARAYEKHPFELCSYCLMTNHYHLLIRAPFKVIPKIMFMLNKRYADYYNKKYQRTGHVFEKRYFSTPVRNMKGLLIASSYIHTNPYGKLTENLEHYEWSSMKFFSVSNPQKAPVYFDPTPVIWSYPGSEEQKKESYIKWVNIQAKNSRESTGIL